MSPSGSPYASARNQRAGDMKCAARSATAHKMGYENYYNPDSGSEIYPLCSNLDLS